MLRKFFNWFSKSDEELDVQVQLPKDEKAKFILKVDGINIGMLYCETGAWYFKYTDDFKKHAEEYNLITGFPDLSKTYQSDSLWPFFQIRIPGLKQPAIQEILEKEKIDKSNEVALLKRFGYKTITNPYQLITA
jgi:HipA-like protein